MEKKLEQNKQEPKMTLLQRVLITGVFGGLFWGFMGSVLYYFNFSNVSPASFFPRSFMNQPWTDRWLGEWVGILTCGVISIVVAILYYAFLKKILGIWIGIAFGVALWGIMFWIANPIFSAVPSISSMNAATIVATGCIYILYGTFIGYSISFDYDDTQRGN